MAALATACSAAASIMRTATSANMPRAAHRGWTNGKKNLPFLKKCCNILQNVEKK
jgi:hypothetical protein